MADQPVDFPPGGLVIIDLGPDWVPPAEHAPLVRDLCNAHGGVVPFHDAYGDVEGPAVGWVRNNGGVLAMVESPNAHPGDHRRARTPIKKTGSKWKVFARVGGKRPTLANEAIRNWADEFGFIKYKVVHLLDQDDNRMCTRAEAVHGDGRTFVFFVPLPRGGGNRNRNRKRKRDADDEDEDDSRYHDDDGVGSATSTSTAALSPISMAPGSDSGEEMPERHAEPVGPPPSKRQKVADTPSFDQAMPDVTSSTAAVPVGVIPTVAMAPVASNDHLLPFATSIVPGGVAPVPTDEDKDLFANALAETIHDLVKQDDFTTMAASGFVGIAGFGPTVPVATAAVAFAAADEEMVPTNGFQDDNFDTTEMENHALAWSNFHIRALKTGDMSGGTRFDIGSSEPWLPIDFSTDDSFTLTTRNTGQENAIDFNGLSSVAW